MAKFLVNNGARIEKKKNCSFESPLTAACCCGNLELIKYLIDEGCVITRRGYDTDLGVAIRNGQTEVVKLLLSLGVVSVNDEQYLDSLLIKDEKNLDMVELLLKSGANPNEDDILTKAVECENYKMVELLLKFGADPNKYSGISPLHVAVCCDNFRLAKLLLENNADVNARMKDYSKIMKYDGALVAMDIAVFRKNKNMYDLLNKYGGSTTTRLEQLEGLNSIYKEST